MGALVSKQRYMQGKVPQKYYADVIWPQEQDLFHKLGFDEIKGLELFLQFCKMDADASGTVDVDECFKYLGGTRTKFTERIYHAEDRFDDHGQLEIGLHFKDFAIIIWNYCTLTPYYMARNLFEIFDVEQVNNLERADIEAMYRMVYDCDAHDDYYINQVSLNKEGYVTKDDFCEQLSRHRHIIDPCLSYQSRLRRKMGGFIMWESLAGFRRRHFSPIDSNSATTEQALLAILACEDPNKHKRKRAADELLADQKAKAAEEEEKANLELRLIEKQQERARRQAELMAEDRHMKLAWSTLEKHRFEFEETEYSVDRVWECKEKRDQMYALFDSFVVIAKEYWDEQDDKELKLNIGTDSDHEARYRDFMRTAEGQLLRQRTIARIALTAEFNRMEEDRIKKTHRITGLPKKSDLQAEIEGALDELERKALREIQIKTLKSGGATRRQLEAIKPVDYGDETRLVKKLCKKAAIKLFEEQARKEIFENRRDLTISSTEAAIAKKQEERQRDYVRVEFEMAQMYGSRITSYSKCRDYKNNKDVYVNTDTLEIIHIKSAICEKCDAIFNQSDLLCKGCNCRRSTKNQYLYRPLGFKDIRIDD